MIISDSVYSRPHISYYLEYLKETEISALAFWRGYVSIHPADFVEAYVRPAGFFVLILKW